jgi:hypothetical protein
MMCFFYNKTNELDASEKEICRQYVLETWQTYEEIDGEIHAGCT